MEFIIQEPEEDQNFSLIYRPEDYSFDIEPLEGTGDTSIMINDLQLEIDYEGKIMYVWGLCPLIKCKEINEFPFKHKPGSLVALLDKPPIPGISYRLIEKERWPIYINNLSFGFISLIFRNLSAIFCIFCLIDRAFSYQLRQNLQNLIENLF